ncbi:MAG: zinc ribbon domain-containing protein [Thermoplasmata archaeon]|nr:zinc ribbon domain-containing protein [Thermoplasmata archaeon]
MTSFSPPGPPPQGPIAPSLACPKCQSAVRASDRFCPACGATLGGSAMPPPPPPPPGPSAGVGAPPPVDIRQRVDDDRGILKKIQLLVPGFRGYRQGEDLREADSVLRLQVADKVHRTTAILADRRQALAAAGQYDGLTDLALALADLQRLEGEIRHAEQGYTGLSAAVRVDLPAQETLYQYDYGFATAADDLANAASSLSDASTPPGPAIATVRSMVSRLEQAFKARISVIEKVAV